jgi:hypothetical protein
MSALTPKELKDRTAKALGFPDAVATPREQINEQTGKLVIVSAHHHDQQANNVDFVRFEGRDAERTAELLKQCGYQVDIYPKPLSGGRKDDAKCALRHDGKQFNSAVISPSPAQFPSLLHSSEDKRRAEQAETGDLSRTESFSQWIDNHEDALASPDSFETWLKERGDSI